MEKDMRAWTIIIVFGVIVGYFSLAWAGVVPEQYNVIEHYFSNEDLNDGDNTTSVQDVDWPEVVVTGIPEVVNLTESSSGSYTITFTASDGACDDMYIMIDAHNSLTNATFELSSNNPYEQWIVYPDGMMAEYVGSSIVPYERVTVTLTISGDEFTTDGYVRVICGSNGYVSANTGIIAITH